MTKMVLTQDLNIISFFDAWHTSLRDVNKGKPTRKRVSPFFSLSIVKSQDKTGVSEEKKANLLYPKSSDIAGLEEVEWKEWDSIDLNYDRDDKPKVTVSIGTGHHQKKKRVLALTNTGTSTATGKRVYKGCYGHRV